MPFSFACDIISLKHLFKIQVQLESPTYKAVLEGSFELNPVKEKILPVSLMGVHCIPSPQIWKIVTPEVSSWRLSIIQMCPFIVMKKSFTPMEEMHSAFWKHKRNTIVFTSVQMAWRWKLGRLCSTLLTLSRLNGWQKIATLNIHCQNVCN